MKFSMRKTIIWAGNCHELWSSSQPKGIQIPNLNSANQTNIGLILTMSCQIAPSGEYFAIVVSAVTFSFSSLLCSSS